MEIKFVTRICHGCPSWNGVNRCRRLVACRYTRPIATAGNALLPGRTQVIPAETAALLQWLVMLR